HMRHKAAVDVTTDVARNQSPNASAILPLQTNTPVTRGHGTTTTNYSTLASTVGGSAQANAQALKGQESVQNQLETLRGQTSGVSTDEELTNVIKFERSYKAAAHLINTAGELLQTLLAVK